MYTITPDILRKISGSRVNTKVVNEIVQNLPEVLETYNINNKLRIAHFLGQLAKESDHFNTYEEYASGDAYEGRRDLGNTKRGDGRRYKGRGPIQITGRFNYRKYGQKLGVDLEDNPQLATDPRIGLMIAGQYWYDHGLNALADRDDGKQITRKINGGYNGLKERLELTERAKHILDHAVSVPEPEPVPEPVVEEVVVVEEPQVEVPPAPLPVFVQQDLDLTNENG